MTGIGEFEKNKEYLVCIDSDGCAMDTMDIKHIKCFGPCMIEEWKLYNWKDEILTRWNEINLYTETRGINRFKGLAKSLKEINDKYCRIDGIDALSSWVDSAKELSNFTVREMYEKTGLSIFQKALNWSIAVNEGIDLIPDEDKKPFEGVLEALIEIHKVADIAIVSSANKEAVKEEWERCKLLQHTDVVCCQDDGTKKDCIEKLLKKGYNNQNVLMVGDALGDCDAAKKNGVFYYPILVKHEKESWEELIKEGIGRFVNNDFTEYGFIKEKEFIKNLSK